MKIVKLANYLFNSTARDRSDFFWLLVFPIILLVILMLIFPSLYEPKEVTFSLTFLSQNGMFSEIIERVFKELSIGKHKIFRLSILRNTEENLNNEIEKLRRRNIDLIVEIPEGFDAQMLNWFMLNNLGVTASSPTINIYSLKHNISSESAYLTVKNILQKLELEFIKKVGYKLREVESEIELIGIKSTFSYIDFIYPGIVIFVVFMTGLFGIGLHLTWLKESGILKRIMVTSLPKSSFIISYIISRIYLIMLQITLISLIAKFLFKTTVNPLSLSFIGYTSLTVICLSSLGFFLASVSKNVSSANAISQILNFPLQFLGGIYFPVSGVPWAIRWLVLINPITYLASGIRDALGIMESPYPLYVTLIVPMAWIIFCLLFTYRRFKLEEV
ncbi:MAG: ABC transporter permease [bacterium]|nr:ABC transporter permease [bacterium]